MTHYERCPYEKPSLKNLNIKEDYNTEDDDIVGLFYLPCFNASKQYDRAVGYFRASIYRELGEPLLDFALNGGKIRLVCSPDLPEAEETAARAGYERRTAAELCGDQRDLVPLFQEMLKNEDETDCLSMLSLLIENGSLDLYIAIRSKGLYHRKVGCFSDGDAFLTFSGSANETLTAITIPQNWGNDEEFDVFKSWGSEYEARKANKKRNYLNQLFSGGTTNTAVRIISIVEREFLAKYRKQSTLEDCRPGSQRRGARGSSRDLLPKPYPFQVEAINAWEGANKRGILAMATGTGKTITALFAIKKILSQGIPVLILVPSTLLLEQWSTEIGRFYPDVPILKAGGNHDWKAQDSKRLFVLDIKKPRIILSTMQTASTPDFIEFISQANMIALIADEVHRLGSEQGRSILKIPFTFLLGLSATPERLFDPEGSKALSDAFGVKPVFEMQIGGTVKISDTESVPVIGKFLSRYYYYFMTIQLTKEEQEEWDRLTIEIRNLYARGINLNEVDETRKHSADKLKLLLIQRARIAKGARNKVECVSEIINKRYPEGGRWIVYCDDEQQLDIVYSRIKKDCPTLPIYKYHSRMSKEQRNYALNWFIESSGIIVSIRCLDEGVDIPNADGAIILASSKNPREYIQRRGRVLRKAKGKKLATIVDTIVTPSPEIECDAPFSLIKAELVRAWEFANYSENKEISHSLWELCMKYNVNIESDGSLGEENIGED